MVARTASRAFIGGIMVLALVVLVRAMPLAEVAVAWDDHLIVHEWGTFTSIAGEDGIALEWRPLSRLSDLPSFVYCICGKSHEVGFCRKHEVKGSLRARVRMETPVVYFYTDRETTVSVRVVFPKGMITEWYPQGSRLNSGIDWNGFQVLPNAEVTLPIENDNSHYYPARETDATPLRVSTDKGTQDEKFLFYRGVGWFDPPLSIRLEGERALVKNLGKGELSQLILFENRGGRVGYHIHDVPKNEVVLDRPLLGQSIESLHHDLKAILMAHGLYEKEAQAMIKTWYQSWFEEGMRVFYVVPRPMTDMVLPITINPRPFELVRVLVGRTEIITPEIEEAIQEQLTKLGDPSWEVRNIAMKIIQRYGRFSEPILKRILGKTGDAVLKVRIEELLKSLGGV